MEDTTTNCDCREHKGQLIVDQEFDIEVDTLFNLIFTDVKFIENLLIKRGMSDTTITNWKRTPSPSPSPSHHSDTNLASGLETNRALKPSLSVDADINNNSAGSRPAKKSDSPPVAPRRGLRLKQARQLNYSMSINHMWAKQVHIEERQLICQLKSGAYTVTSETRNSGIPYGESFTVNISYCFTKGTKEATSRMQVYAIVNFNKDKQTWRLNMVKSLIERQSIQGVKDFISDLIVALADYATNNSTSTISTGSHVARDDSITQKEDSCQPRSSSMKRRSELNPGAHSSQTPRCQYRHSSLVRAKSRLKERKLKSMYKYYIRDNDSRTGSACSQPVGEMSSPETEPAGGMHQGHWNKTQSEASFAGSESSFSSFNDIDETESMIMMLNNAEDGAKWDKRPSSIERSFSDVETTAGSLRIRADAASNVNCDPSEKPVGRSLGKLGCLATGYGVEPIVLMWSDRELILMLVCFIALLLAILLPQLMILRSLEMINAHLARSTATAQCLQAPDMIS